ncbi:response regulator [Paenibacillus sp. MSJ-34]|uniref:response regulator n=1 Tax=Paenibacillus sp. MSJ-34 TaxID=2841529 RepID=UPI001C107FB9|nr:response regulator [Paenibacillus sp. MSJ-34]MBU5441289.1 response regulator [Paenibacillus sp. MSJ-34]
MKKLLLVDDEILIRETIRDCIQWEKEGFEYCGDASDGEVALPMIEQLRPDILITDIKMPFMNGLELSEIVRKRMPEVKIIILSGHGEFEFARSAIRMGIEEYCLKPVSSADLIGLLRKVGEKIDKERSERERIEQLRQSERDNAALSKAKLLGDLCNGLLAASDAIRASAALSLQLIARYYAVAMLDVRIQQNDISATRSIPGDEPQEAVWPLPQFHAGHREEILEFKASRTKTVWIVKGNDPETMRSLLEPFRQFQESSSEQTGDLFMAVGIGSVQERLQGIHISYLEAEEDMHWRRLSRQNRRNLWEATRGSLNQRIFLDRNSFIGFLKVGSPAQTGSFVREFAAELRLIDWNSSLIGYYILNDITLEVFRTAEELYRSPNPHEDLLPQFQKSIEAVRTWEEACAYLTRLAEQFWLWRSRSSDRYADLLMKVKEYVHSNYDKDQISLQDAAEHVKMSPSHLSKIFSQETGQTFIDYLTQTRIRKAMELLQSTQAKTYEIAFQVGYNDAHYFSNVFKRVTGMTTTEFRKQGTIVESLNAVGRG